MLTLRNLSLISFFCRVARGVFVTKNAQLQIDVYHGPAVAVSYQGSTNLTFSPTTFTLIHSDHEAILVDSPVLNSDGEALADWIAMTIPNKALTGIYITHGHADHFLSAPVIQTRFPSARILVKEDVYIHINETLDPANFDPSWATLFPGVTAPTLHNVDVLPPSGSFQLEGHNLQALQVGESDTVNTTVLYVPELATVVTGDVVYGHCYQSLAEDLTVETRQQWLQSIAKVQALHPKFVIPSHALPTNDFGVEHFAQTIGYIKAWEKALTTAASWQELEGFLSRLYPGYGGDFILRYSAQTVYNAAF